MAKKSKSTQPKKRQFQVPGVGIVEAVDLSKVGAELKKKQEQDNGNK